MKIRLQMRKQTQDTQTQQHRNDRPTDLLAFSIPHDGQPDSTWPTMSTFIVLSQRTSHHMDLHDHSLYPRSGHASISFQK